MKDLKQQLINSLIGVDHAHAAGDSTATWQTPDWGSLKYKTITDGYRDLTEQEKRELFLLQYHDDRYRGLDINRLAEFDPIKARVPMQSLCDMLYTLAQFDHEYFDLIDRHGDLDNPFEMERYVGQFHGVDMRNVDQRMVGVGGTIQKKSVSVYVSMPTHPRWNVFECVDRMLDTGTARPGRGLGHFLHIMSRYGWFDKGKYDLHIEAKVSSDLSLLPRWRGGKYSDRTKEPEWILEDVTVSVGEWQFVQQPRGLQSPYARRLASYGYDDQIAIRKSTTKGMEQIHLYLDGGGERQPIYDIYRDNELDGLIGGDIWTEKELQLAEMLEIRSEIFLDKPNQLPILGAIQRLTPDTIASMDNKRRVEIFSKFGEGTIKIPKT